MRKRLFWWETGGFLFTAALGSLLHYVYEWSGSPVAAAFSAVNESTWEHMKLLFFPVFLYSLVQLCFEGRNYPNFLSARAAAVLTGLVLIPALFYTYTGVLGYHVMWADILVFFLAALGVFWLDFHLLERGGTYQSWRQVLGLAVLWGLAFLFVYFTFQPPHLGLWRDPVTGLYGIP